MNAMLASGGYPWTVVRVEDREAYLASLDRASIDMDIGPFAPFLAERVRGRYGRGLEPLDNRAELTSLVEYCKASRDNYRPDDRLHLLRNGLVE
jgi:hypothetical protein